MAVANERVLMATGARVRDRWRTIMSGIVRRACEAHRVHVRQLVDELHAAIRSARACGRYKALVRRMLSQKARQFADSYLQKAAARRATWARMAAQAHQQLGGVVGIRELIGKMARWQRNMSGLRRLAVSWMQRAKLQHVEEFRREKAAREANKNRSRIQKARSRGGLRAARKREIHVDKPHALPTNAAATARQRHRHQPRQERDPQQYGPPVRIPQRAASRGSQREYDPATAPRGAKPATCRRRRR